jgi:hypothetical protein
MRSGFGRRVGTSLGLGLLLMLAAGCGNNGYDKYVPPEETARDALEAALNSWKNGDRPGKITRGSVDIQVADTRWSAGQKLLGYEIVKEEESSEGPRWFTVKLTLPKPAGEQTVRYVVVGKNPLWVYTEETYKRPAGM